MAITRAGVNVHEPDGVLLEINLRATLRSSATTRPCGARLLGE